MIFDDFFFINFCFYFCLKDILEYSEPSSSPVPPYMPIQGTRRTTSLDKKKKTKDKCTHQ